VLTQESGLTRDALPCSLAFAWLLVRFFSSPASERALGRSLETSSQRKELFPTCRENSRFAPPQRFV
jgi:hypothetical protein